MGKNSSFDLTQGGILSRLLLVAIPIMGSSLLQMVYNLTDMFWLGRLSSEAVAASGSGGMFLWLSMSLLMIGRMGAEIGVSQNLGRKDEQSAREFSQTALFIALALGLVYGGALVFGSRFLLGIFNIQEASVVEAASGYLSVVGLGIPFTFISGVLIGTFNGSGNSRRTFFANVVGVTLNVILDPIMIFGMNMGVLGAAIATVIAQATVCFIFLWSIKNDANRPFAQYTFFNRLDTQKVRQIFTWSTPIAIENMLFTSLAMLVSRQVAAFGAEAIAAQRVGSQIESLSWLIGGGFASALTAFVGQNFGAGKWTRISQGFRIAVGTMFCWGLVVTAVLYFGGGFLIGLFLPEPNIIAIGIPYLQILALCQVTTCLEGVASGSFRGVGKTLPPSVISICSNILRVPLAYLLSHTSLGLIGIWWASSLTAILRGGVMFIWYLISSRRQPKEDVEIAVDGTSLKFEQATPH